MLTNQTNPTLYSVQKQDIPFSHQRRIWRGMRPSAGTPSRFDPDTWQDAMEWAHIHQSHPAEYAYINKSLREGFALQLALPEEDLSPAHGNLPTSEHEKRVIAHYLERSRRLGRCAGPFPSAQSAEEASGGPVRINPLGCVHTSGKDRPIMDLSAPHSTGTSLNAALTPEWCTVQYISFLQLVLMCATIGTGGWLWILDAAEAYLQLKIRHTQHRLLGARWAGCVWVFNVLMLGLASAPRIYTHFADVVLWIFSSIQPSIWRADDIPLVAHYLDDFFGGSASAAVARLQFQLVVGTFYLLNIPFKASKAVAPSQAQKILGIVYDLCEQEVRLPEVKVTKYLKHITQIMQSDFVYKSDLLSLAGQLRHASVAVFGGQAFVRGIEAAAHRLKRLHFRRRVTAEIREDLDFWRKTLPVLQRGVPFSYYLSDPKAADISVCSDASGTIGMGATATTGEYFQCRWTDIWPSVGGLDIYFGETLAIVVFAELLSARWTNLNVTLYIDNACTEWALRRKRCKDGRLDIACLIRCIAATANERRFRFWSERISSADNEIADALSRFREPIPARQPARFGSHPLSAAIPLEEVRRGVKTVLGRRWSPHRPPCDFTPRL